MIHICEKSAVRAASCLIEGLEIHAGLLTSKQDKAWIKYRLVPSFLKAIEQIDGVVYCSNFDQDRVIELVAEERCN